MSEFTMTVLGCDGSWPGPGGACSSYLLRTSSTAVLVDMGPGSLANLQLQMMPQDLDAIILSHEHPDHCAEIHSLDVMLRCSSNSPLPVYASQGVLEQTFPRSQLQSGFEWTELEDGDELEIGDLTIRTSRTDHPVVTHALRVDHDGRSLAYTADTGSEWSLTSLGTGIDLALCEAAFPSDISARGHSNSKEAAQMARDAGAMRLMLTHIRPLYNREFIRKEAESVFEGEVVLAETGNTYTV